MHRKIKPHLSIAQRARKFKKVQATKLVKSNESKKIFREIALLAVLNFFLVQKLIFGHFSNSKKLNLAKNIFHEIDLFDFTCFFFAWTFVNFLAYCERIEYYPKINFCSL